MTEMWSEVFVLYQQEKPDCPNPRNTGMATTRGGGGGRLRKKMKKNIIFDVQCSEKIDTTSTYFLRLTLDLTRIDIDRCTNGTDVSTRFSITLNILLSPN